MNENSLDTLLSKIGEFGRYQIRVITLLLLVIAFSYVASISWLFETKNLNYRCSIPECDEDVLDLKPAWWTNAIPSISNEPAKCSRFKSIGNINGTNCSSIDFDKNILLACDEYIYETSERSILQDFNLHCDENLWKLTTVGTLNSIGSLIGLPLIGILSDKYGRKTILINSILLCAISGLIRSFVNSYIFYMVMVFVDSFFNAATYTTAFTLAVEFISPKQRVIVVSLISLFYAFGGVITGTVAWLLQSWRPLLQILYGVQLLIVTYYWLLPESVRWLLIKERYLEAQKILNDIGREKQFNVPLQTLKDLQAPVDQLVDAADVNTTLKQFFKSRLCISRINNQLRGIVDQHILRFYTNGVNRSSWSTGNILRHENVWTTIYALFLIFYVQHLLHKLYFHSTRPLLAKTMHISVGKMLFCNGFFCNVCNHY
ncbi:organic cation transporter protein-like isoform X3 [Photinus pyralis]|uniref:organic cation transporter protein-like isoform X3 n=1 Tax=Photinus pyralis TaxID=7054 RepID=UPI001266FE10|nr:organic cation transporter protein-like isoform X3 [Photinus pyralis]